MASVQAQMTVKLDAGSLVSGLLADLGGISGRIAGLDLAVTPGDIEAGVDLGSGLDLGTLETVLGQLVASLEAQLVALPGVAQVLEPIQVGLDLAGELGSSDFQARVKTLCEEITAILEGEREGGLIAGLTRAFELVAKAPESQVVLDLLGGLAGDISATDLGPLDCVADVLPALHRLIDSFAGLMALESALFEAERLTSAMAPLLDGDAVRGRLSALCAQIERADLEGRSGALDSLDATGREAFAVALEAAADELASVRAELTEAMAFGESTLVYLDMPHMEADVGAAAAMLRTGDLAPLARLLEKAASAAEPLLAIDLSAAPIESLEAMLVKLEAQQAEIIGQIDSLDPVELMGPVGDGLETITEVFETVQQALTQITVAVEAAAGTVVGVVEALPLDDLARTIEGIVAPVAAALDQVRSLVGGVSDAIETTAGAAQAVLTDLEGLVDSFIAAVEKLFGEAREIVDKLSIDTVVGGVAEQIKAFADLLAQAEMKPVFDGAVVTIDTTADVVAAVPLNLLPASVKEDFDAVAAPVRSVDARRVQVDLEALLGLEADGTFALRTALEAAIADVQATFDALIEALADLDPRQHLAALDGKLAGLAGEIEAVSPQLGLEPIQQAIDAVKAGVGNLDLDALLAPVGAAFDSVTESLRGLSPAQLLAPIEEQLETLREALLGSLNLETVKRSITDLRQQAKNLAAPLDPVPLEPRIVAALGELQTLADGAPRIPLSGFLGTLVPSLSSAGDLRVFPWTFPVVASWLGETDGAAHLEGRSARIAEAIEATHAQIRSLDLSQLSAELLAKTEPIRSAISASTLADDPRLGLAASRLDVASAFGSLGPNRQRYLALLESASISAGSLSSLGLSEVRETLANLRAAFDPLAPLTEFLRRLLVHIGLEGIEDGVAGVLRQVFSVATPQRLADLFVPLLAALHRRAVTLIDAVLDPFETAIDTVIAAIEAISLEAVRAGIDSIVEAAVREVAALDPRVLLEAPLSSLRGLLQEVQGFDPLAPIQATLEALRDATSRVVGKLSAERMLADPLAVYEQILGELSKLDIQALIEPILIQLDAIALQIDIGLEDTVVAFEKLQGALPAPGGGVSVSVDVEIG